MIDDFKTSKALLDKAQALADLHGYRLDIQGAKFEPVPTETYLKESYLANDTEQQGISYNANTKSLPIYQIDIYTPKGQGGKFSGMAIANLVKEEFKRAPMFFNDSTQTAQITNVSSLSVNSNDTHNLTVVSVDVLVLATST